MIRRLTATMLPLMLASVCFAQTEIRVEITTNGPVALAPAFAAFHDGSYDIFNVGDTASAGLELLAEVGDASSLIGDLPAGVTAGGFAPGGPFMPNGGTGSRQFTVSSGQSHFSLASMVLPSNDWFIGNDSAMDISGLLSAAPGTSVSFALATAYDAGTEEEDFQFSPGNPLVGITTPSNPGLGAETTEAISMVSGPDPFSGFLNIEPAGFDTTTIDFTNGTIATVSLTVVPEPSGLSLMMAAAIGLMGLRRYRR